MAFQTPALLRANESATVLRRQLSPRRPRARRFTVAKLSQGPDKRSLDALIEVLRSRQTESVSSNLGRSNHHQGTVYLVGTGPGDPGLLTLSAIQLMQNADVVLYDRLVSESILSFVNPRATMIYVGKESGFHTRSQDDIHLLLSAFASGNNTVVRLKGGDPFVFGRGGEETDFLERAGIRVTAIPGITAASGIAAALGIPLTMRGYATSVRYLTGHLRDGVNLDFGDMDDQTTYVVYMGLNQLEAIARAFQCCGLSESTPAVAIERGTTPQQRVLACPLQDLPKLVADASFSSPTLFVLGSVVSLSSVWDRQGQVLSTNDYPIPWPTTIGLSTIGTRTAESTNVSAESSV